MPRQTYRSPTPVTRVATVVNVAALVAGLFLSGSLQAQQKQTESPPNAPAARTLADRPAITNPAATQAPFLFEKNIGQANGRADFLVRHSDYNAFLTGTGIVTVLRGFTYPFPEYDDERSAPAPGGKNAGLVEKPYALHMQLVGASERTRLSGSSPVTTKVSYFTGRDRAKWIRDVPMFQGVTYSGVYRDTDMIVENGDGKLRYHFVVGERGDPKRIRMRFTTIRSAGIGADGTLVLTLQNGRKVQHRPPRAYEYSENLRREVEVAFELVSADTVGFSLPQRTRSTRLLIDPQIDFATYFGGTLSESPVIGIVRSNQINIPSLDIELDREERLLVGGTTFSTDLPNAAGPAENGEYNAFAARLNIDPAGTATWDYINYFGGSKTELGMGVSPGGDGESYLCGSTSSEDFPLPGNPLSDKRDPNGTIAGFILRLSPSGTPTASTLITPGNTTFVHACDFDPPDADSSDPGFLHFTGTTYHNSGEPPQLNPTYFQADAAQNVLTGRSDAYAASISADLSTLGYFTLINGRFSDVGIDIKVHDHEAFITGVSTSFDFPVTPDAAAEPTLDEVTGLVCGEYFFTNKCFDGFAARIKSDGTDFRYVTMLEYDRLDAGYAIDVDALGMAYVGGRGIGGNTGTMAFVVKISPNGHSFVYRTEYGGHLGITYDISVDGINQAHVVGETQSDILARGGAVTPVYQGGETDGFYGFLDSTGQVAYFTYLGGEDLDAGMAMARDRNHCSYIGLTTLSDTVNVPLGGAPQGSRAGGHDVLIARHCAPPDIDELIIEKTVPNFAATPGQLMTFRVTVENPGLSIQGPVTIRDVLPLPFAPVSVAGPNCSISGLLVTCTLPFLPPGITGIAIDAYNQFSCTDPGELRHTTNTATVIFPDGSERSADAQAFYHNCYHAPPPRDGPCETTDDCGSGQVCFAECALAVTCFIRIGRVCIGRNETPLRRAPVCSTDPVVYDCSRILD